MATEIIDKYTRSLYNIINIDLIDIWENIDFNLPSFVSIDDIKEYFVYEYNYHEIAFETIAKWLYYLNAKVNLLSKKYTNLFTAFNTQYGDADIYSNNLGEFETSNKLYSTPQTQIDGTGDYLTQQQDNTGSESYLRGMTKAEAREIYVNKLRNIYYEYIREFKDLFFKLF